ncbi:hypothetical protein ACROYT_G030590 [Oculina patagonica]
MSGIHLEWIHFFLFCLHSFQQDTFGSQELERQFWLFLPGSPGWQSIHLTGAISGYISVKESTLQRLRDRRLTS